MSIKDLSVGERIVFRDASNIDQYSEVQQVYCDENQKYYAYVKLTDGRVAMINENTDFISLPKSTSKEVEKTLDEKVNHPSHYTYGDIEIIDFIEQVTKDYKPELAFAIGNAIKYISRANRKNGKEDLDKARWYLNRVFEKWEG
ncbi:hypothetical protein A9J32_07895 [Staphylococcus epidermidis]|uniref:DUF3310 domain-containing protein n=1 Tax=Staphylococcus epidermidis TaxID=1282 RepID=UPI0007E4C885|nr:DUF3310 domain-containing protein [Staphylococcus epidermidis]MBM6005588.1 DUF3310 domain-containing protein [Staphylococcus epidermidis]MBM6085581.1 DUF3310 domain-containing protein [Staphylococcus epidermidis]MBM6088081.1 DUF3310 domain-containing protein [Staphylococcus epidermidis]MBM6090551.1 DUF3310 domain-containing protein [Staphylococcus epidermidis]MBM6093078.1 DUF3310 domain-containing protein [Staphylococcus epidermidis]